MKIGDYCSKCGHKFTTVDIKGDYIQCPACKEWYIKDII